jgi:hypothetical protein
MQQSCRDSLPLGGATTKLCNYLIQGRFVRTFG